MDECKHEKLVTKSTTKDGHITRMVQYCGECDSTREREILSVRLGIDKDGKSGFSCFSDSASKWTKMVS